MNHQRISRVTSSLAQYDSRDTASQATLLGDLALLRIELESAGDPVRANCAQAATQLLQYLNQLGCIGPEGIIKVVATLVSNLHDTTATEDDPPLTLAEDNEPFARQAAPQTAAAGVTAGSTSPRAPLPAFRDIDLANSRTDLRMLSDCLLGEVLIQMHIIDRSALERALEVQGATGMRIGEALVDVGVATWDQIQDALRHQEDQKQR